MLKRLHLRQCYEAKGEEQMLRIYRHKTQTHAHTHSKYEKQKNQMLDYVALSKCPSANAMLTIRKASQTEPSQANPLFVNLNANYMRQPTLCGLFTCN